MTQFPHDQFVKDYLPELLQDYGEVTPSLKVAPEIKEIDVLFIPSQTVPTTPNTLGQLGKLAQKACLLEVYRNPVTSPQIRACLTKLFEIQSKLGKQEKTEDNLPVLWILTPTLSNRVLEGYGATEPVEKWGKGIYIAPADYFMGIVVIHQLQVTEETLWLRILGRDSVKQQAITELNDLPDSHPKKNSILELVYGLLAVLEINKQQGQSLDTEDEQLIMKISTLYLEKLEQAKNQGLEEGRQEGLIEGKLQTIPRLLSLGLSLEKIAEILEIDQQKVLETVQKLPKE